MWQEWIVTDCVSDLTDTTRYRDGHATISPSFFIICHPCIQMSVCTFPTLHFRVHAPVREDLMDVAGVDCN